MPRRLACGCFLLLAAGLLPLTTLAADFQTPAISAEALRDRQQGDDPLLVIDVRDPVEFRIGHVPGAINLPESDLANHLEDLAAQPGVVLYCIAGTRTQRAEQTLIDHKVPNVFHLEDGLMGWLDSGFAVEKGAGHEQVGSGASR